MSETLYSRDILRLAMDLGDGEPLEHTDGASEMRAPLCGSKVELSIHLDEAHNISGISIIANACAVGQASAAILKRHAVGMTVGEVERTREQIASCLLGECDMPVIWEELSALQPARDYPARHGAILLPYDALLAALADAESRRAA